MWLAWIPFPLLIAATAIDVRRREIPDWVPMALLTWAAGSIGFDLVPHGWGPACIGLGVGFALGLLLFWRGGFGGGDAKLLAALGAVLAWPAFVSFLVCSAVAGGVLAFVALARGRHDLAYAPAFALGFLMFMIARSIP